MCCIHMYIYIYTFTYTNTYTYTFNTYTHCRTGSRPLGYPFPPPILEGHLIHTARQSPPREAALFIAALTP